jgi:hypothetical protein
MWSLGKDETTIPSGDVNLHELDNVPFESDEDLPNQHHHEHKRRHIIGTIRSSILGENVSINTTFVEDTFNAALNSVNQKRLCNGSKAVTEICGIPGPNACSILYNMRDDVGTSINTFASPSV